MYLLESLSGIYDFLFLNICISSCCDKIYHMGKQGFISKFRIVIDNFAKILMNLFYEKVIDWNCTFIECGN